MSYLEPVAKPGFIDRIDKWADKNNVIIRSGTKEARTDFYQSVANDISRVARVGGHFWILKDGKTVSDTEKFGYPIYKLERLRFSNNVYTAKLKGKVNWGYKKVSKAGLKKLSIAEQESLTLYEFQALKTEKKRVACELEVEGDKKKSKNAR